jgi:hypothetical protein
VCTNWSNWSSSTRTRRPQRLQPNHRYPRPTLLEFPPATRATFDKPKYIFGLMEERYTEKQGQYLAFIYYYTKIHGVAPAEAEMQRYFGVTPPAVHQMVLSLERKGLVERRAGAPRSIKVLLARHELPDLV